MFVPTESLDINDFDYCKARYDCGEIYYVRRSS
jgi:hypothetical protein